MRISKTVVSGAIAGILLVVLGVSAQRNMLGASPQAAQPALVCAAAAPALPAGHPPLAPQTFGGLSCDSEPAAAPGGGDAAAGRSLVLPAQYRPASPLPAFQHVLVTDETGAAVSVLGDCAGCHGSDQVLSEGHVPTADMPLAQCRACHAPQGDLSLRGAMPLDHTHALAGIGCTSCHDAADPVMQDPGTETCKACHGSLEDLATLTADVTPTNPHSSPHGAPYAECSLCHLQHEPSQDFCASCHDFDFQLP